MTARTFSFAAPIGLSAFLLFSVEPLVGRLVLPIFGGTPAVWATTLFFFQAVLLAGYLYAHVSVTWFGRWGPPIHVALAGFGIVAHTAGVPPKVGSTRRPTSGSTEKSRNADRPIGAANENVRAVTQAPRARVPPARIESRFGAPRRGRPRRHPSKGPGCGPADRRVR